MRDRLRFLSPRRPAKVRYAVRDDADPRVLLLLELGKNLHVAGFSAPMLEASLDRVARHLGVRAQFFSTPTSIFSAFGQGQAQTVHLARVEPATVDLGKLVELEGLIDAVCDDAMSPEQAVVRVGEIAAGRPPYGRIVTLASHAVSSATSATFLGGSWREVVVAAVIGASTGLLALAGRRIAAVARLFEFLAAGAAAVIAIAAAHWLPPLSVFTVTLAGLIILLPGFGLTVALNELATRHLASGTARLSGALVTFVTLAFGVALGSRIGELVFGPVPLGASGTGEGWAEVFCLLLAPAALAVLLRAPWRELPYLVLAGFIGFYGGRWGARGLSPELGMFVGAFVLGLASNLYAWWRRRPAATTLVPGILLLVPGGLGYRSVTELLSRDVVPGIATAIDMTLVAVSLVAGLLAANELALPRGTQRRRSAATHGGMQA